MSTVGKRHDITVLERKLTVQPQLQVSSLWAVPQAYDRKAAVILAHGAGNDMHNPLLVYVHELLARHGLLSLRFNFPYKERGGKAPDRGPLLEATWKAVIAAVRNDAELAPKRLFLGGKSMGGRIASQVAAQGEPCAGLIFLGYPLHPPNRPERLRTGHWPQIRCPMLFIEGTRDPLCSLDLLRAALPSATASSTVHVIDGADHSFNVLKRLGRSTEEVRAEIVAAIVDWMSEQA